MPQNGPFHIKLSLARAKSVAAFKTMILSYCAPNPLLPCSSRLSKWFFPASQAVQMAASLVPPWCLAGCPIDPFLPPWCLQAVQLILSCLPGASQAVQMVFPASLVPPWCLPGALQTVQLILSCLPGASKPSKWFFPASLVPRSLSKWFFLMVFSCLPGASLAPRKLSN